MSRKPLSKTIRFEVFKRDRFTCQYCGRSAPDVVLEVDHIKPYSKGGKDEIINLVTACRDCNRGKTNRELDDYSAVKVQRQQMDTLQERRDQLEMMLLWRDELKKELDAEANEIAKFIEQETIYIVADGGIRKIKNLIRRFGFIEVYTATELSFSKYYNGSEGSWDNAFYKIGGICYNRMKARECNAEQDT